MKITVTRSPATNGYSDRYDNLIEECSAIINVSDTPELSFTLASQGKPSFWFPIHETNDWGYAPFYGSAKVVDHYKTVVIHCLAGVNRSKCVAYAILKAEGFSDVDISNHINDDVSRLFGYNMNKWGCIPFDIIPFLQARKINPTYSIAGLLQEIKSPNLIVKRPLDTGIKIGILI